MVDSLPAGPSSAAEWVRRTTGVGEARPLSVLLLPDAANVPMDADRRSQVYYGVLERPLLVRDAAGNPVLSLTLVLDRMPTAADETVAPLIREGILNFDVTLAVPAGAVEELQRTEGFTLRPLFVQEAAYTVVAERGGQERPIAEAKASGAAARAALQAHLDREEALDVLAALDGVESRIRLRGSAMFRTAGLARTIRLRGSWADIHDFLSTRLDAVGETSFAGLRSAFEEMVRSGLVSVLEESPYGRETPMPGPDAATLFDLFMRLSFVVLQRRTIGLPPDSPDNRYALRARPHPMFSLDYRQKLTGPGRRSVSFDAGLEQIIGGALDGLDRGGFIHLHGPDMQPVPRRVRTSRAGRGTGGGPRLRLAAVDGGVKSVALAMRPGASVARPQALVASDLVLVQSIRGSVTHWLLDDLVLEALAESRPRDLPIVADPDAAAWPGRADPAQYWYAPTFTLVQPAPNVAREASPFLFTFERTGVTVSGQPALRGTVRFTLQAGMSDKTRSALQRLGNPKARPLPIGGLSVPFVDERDGRVKSHAFTADVTRAGETFTATVTLLNEWVRLCYGALSEPGFQAEMARLSVTCTFQAYVPLRKEDVELALAGKVAVTPFVRSVAEARTVGGPYLDAMEGVYRHPMGEVRLKREPPQVTPVPAPRSAQAASRAGTALVAATAARPVVLTAQPKPRPVLVARPLLTLPQAVAEVVDRTKYAVRTLARQERLEALYPCAGLGAFYVEKSATGEQAIGCRDALRLGQTSYRQYEEMTELAHARYRVYRSLQQPGRFLVLPAAYQITRYAPTEAGKAYRPVVAVYSSIDIAEPANNRVIFHATLQPDIPPFVRRELRTRLLAHAREPVVEYPTEVQADLDYAWTVDRSIKVEPSAVRTPDSFQVTLATDLAGALLVRTLLQAGGVHGSVSLRLPDGSVLQSPLMLGLDAITGPWETGPVETARVDGNLRLTNRTERTVDVSDLLVHDAPDVGRRVRVDTSLAPGASHTVALGGQAAEVYPVYSVPPGAPAALEEIRNVVEDIHTNVIFINLVRHENHGLSRLDVRARIKDVAGEYPVVMSGDPPQGAVDIILPLTTYLAQHTLQFQVTRTFQSGEVSVTPWLEWDLEQEGNIVSLTWELVQ